MSVKLISQLLTTYHLSNLVSFNDYIDEIKSQSHLTKEELKQLINDSKSNLQDDFNSNLHKVAEEINFDLNTKVEHPFVKDLQINLIDFMAITSINPTNKAILEWFDSETKKLIS